MARTRYLWSIAILAGIVVLGTPPPAEAAFKVRLSFDNGTTWNTVQDNMAGDSDATAGFINASFSGNGFNVIVSLGTSKPLIGSASSAEIDNSVLATHNVAGTGSFLIQLTDTGFGLPPGNALITSTITGQVTGNPSSLAFQSWASSSNAEFATSGLTGGPQGPLSGVVNSTATGFGSLSSPFSVTNQMTVTLSGTGSLASVDGHTTVTNPEPATIVAALAGLPALGGFWWRRRKEAALAV